MDKSKLNLIPATFTPMKEDGSIDLERIPGYAAFLSKRGIKTVFVNGSTGECMSLTVVERKQLLEAWIKQRSPNGISTVVVHVGAESIADCKDMASHAAASGADAVSLVSPCYFKPKTVEALISFCSGVAAAAAPLPFYYYHIPGITGVTFNMESFLTEASKKIPTLRGVKFSSADLMDASLCQVLDDGAFHVMYGCDEQSLAARAMGIHSYVGSTYNFLPEAYIRMHAAFDEGNTAEAHRLMVDVQKIVQIYFQFMGKYYVGALKQFMSEAGYDMGPPRLPLVRMEDADRNELSQQLRQAGFYEQQPKDH